MTRTLPPPLLPRVLSRVVLAAGATTAALAAPLPTAAVIAAGAAVPLLVRRGVAPAAGATVLAATGATLALTPLWILFGTGLDYVGALAVTAALAARLGAVLLVGLALGATLPAAAWLGASKRFPRVGLALLVTFRQVPEVAADAERVRAAQRARGLLVDPVLSLRALIVPLVVRALARADRISAALLLAGWGESPRRAVAVSPWRPTDTAWTVLGIVLLVAPFAPTALG